MSAFPAYCPHCKSIFPFKGIALGEGVSIGLENIVTNCPVCGFGEARVSDGVYRATKDAIEVLAGPDNTRAMAEALKTITERLVGGQITHAEAAEKAAELSQKYAALLESCSKLGLPGIALLVSIIALYLQYEGNKSSSVDAKKLLDAVTEQTVVLKDLVRKYSIDIKRSVPSGKISQEKALTVEGQPDRRAQVNNERRKKLQKRRKDFGGARRH